MGGFFNYMYIYNKLRYMNRSYSKIRHIQEANQKLEKRLISEEENYEDNFDFDINQIDCGGEDMSSVDYDADNNTIVINYCDESELGHLKKKGIRLAVGRFGSDYLDKF